MSEGLPLSTLPPAEQTADASGTGADVMAEAGGPLSSTLSCKESAFEASTAVSVALTFIDLTYSVKIKGKKDKVILNKLNGHVQPGTFVAIMGPSGAGKTSLINVLAGRVLRSRGIALSGKVLVNGEPRGDSFRRLSAYVMQGDTMFSCLTVEETLWVAARLRLPSSFPMKKKMEMVESIVAELGLAKARDTPIGNDLIRGVSGGERKRTSIAVEMLSNPSLIFLDEPTSGLDSFQALNVMSCMADLAHGGRTVIATIHQPRSSIFTLFEDLILLSEGRMVYSGRASNSVGYFAARGFTCPEHYNPADYFMDVTSLDTRDPELESSSKERVKSIAESFEPAEYTIPPLNQKAIEEQQHHANRGVDKGYTRTKFASGYWMQFSTLCRRSLWQVTRDKLPIFVAFFQALFMSLILSLLYYGQSSGPQQIQNFQGAIFFMCIFMAFSGVVQMIITFPYERKTLNQERLSNCYRIAAYYPAKVLMEWPLRVSPVILFICIVYWPIQFQRTAAKFFLFLAVGVLEFTSMSAVGLAIGACSPTPETALAFGPMVTILFGLFGGFFVNLESIPIWLRWFRYLSPIQWGFVGLATNQFSGLTFSCPPDTYGCVTSGEQVLENLNISNFTTGEAIGYQACLIVGMNFIAFLALLLNGPKMQPFAKTGKATAKAAGQ